jgi:hypothetical protein
MAGTNTVFQPQALAAATNDIRDIRPPLELPNPWIYVWMALGIIALLAFLLALAIFLVRRHRRRLLPPPPLPAHLRARQRLQEALVLISKPKPFCIAVSDTLRAYLEERFDFHAPERTTEEFLHELQDTDRLALEQKASLGGFLESCDLVKFARYEPAEAELRGLHAAALQLVEETEPKAQPVGESTVEQPQPA